MNKWDKRFMDLAEQISTWSSCYKMHVGAVIVKGNRIISNVFIKHTFLFYKIIITYFFIF